jgi:hypothetical protein
MAMGVDERLLQITSIVSEAAEMDSGAGDVVVQNMLPRKPVYGAPVYLVHPGHATFRVVCSLKHR